MYISKPTLIVILHMVVINSRKKKEVFKFESQNLNHIMELKGQSCYYKKIHTIKK
jgi:hypothetical protein